MKGAALMCKKSKQKQPLNKPDHKGYRASARRAVMGFHRNPHCWGEDSNFTFIVNPEEETERIQPESKK
jgi:hypothetical protein